MQLLLVMGGSLGDHLPVLEIGREAVRRGHRVVALGCEKFLAGAAGSGIDLRPTSTAAEYEEFCHSVAHDPPLKQLALFRQIAARDQTRIYDILRTVDSFDETAILVVKFPLGIGGRLIGEQFGAPVAEYHVDPLPMFAGRMGWERRAFLFFHDRFVNRVFGPDFNSFRKKLGLPAVRNMCQWAEENLQLMCGLYPEWIGRARRFHEDPRFVCAGFAGLDGIREETLPSVVEEFLAAGPPPVLVSQPSWSAHNARFRQETEQALARAGLRGILTGSDCQSSNPNVLVVPFLPHRLVLPRAAAFIHHGGSGTAATALAAGVPQLLVPQLAVQHDVSARLELLGVGRVVPPRRYRARRVAQALAELANSSAIRTRCRELSDRLRHDGSDGARRACDALEDLVRRTARPAAPLRRELVTT
jgi:rhamnosyltransferase subunit B